MAKEKTKRKKPATSTPPADNSGQPVAQVPVPTACTACPKCGSSNRGKITSTKRRDYGGIFRGELYDYQIRKWTSCADCGQRRVIIEHHRGK